MEQLIHEQSRSSGSEGLKPGSAYALLLLLFVLSRIAYYLLGVRFDARPVLNFFQFIDPELLKHRLLESLYHLHIQPPGFNLYTGIVLKLFPNAYPAVFHAIHLVLGISICCLTYYLMSVCGVTSWLAFILSNLSRYESRMERSLFRSLHELQRLQAAPKRRTCAGASSSRP